MPGADSHGKRTLDWTEADEKILQRHIADTKAGKVRVIDITHMSTQEMRALKEDDPRFRCGNCDCHDPKKIECTIDCPCHKL